MRILIFGITGMLGHVLMRVLSKSRDYDVYGTIRKPIQIQQFFPQIPSEKIIQGVAVENLNSLSDCISHIQPEVIINCIAMTQEVCIKNNPSLAIQVNSLLPHYLSKTCQHNRLIHISTDSVFNGLTGKYSESDQVSCSNMYSSSKYLSELSLDRTLTLRTSIIGHEIMRKKGLLEWFLANKSTVIGFRESIFSGFSTLELAKVIKSTILPNDSIQGLFHISSEPISKFDLLKKIANKYGKNNQILPDDEYVSDLSLDSSLFRSTTGYEPPSWDRIIDMMYDDFLLQKELRVY
jgi:dTDP-4-dehydrorhamnose reductase